MKEQLKQIEEGALREIASAQGDKVSLETLRIK